MENVFLSVYSLTTGALFCPDVKYVLFSVIDDQVKLRDLSFKTQESENVEVFSFKIGPK